VHSTIIKYTKDRKINPWSGLTRIEAFLLEKECLTTLNNNFKCICKEPRIHFPKIVAHDANKFKFELTKCGYAIDTSDTWPYYIKNVVLNENCQIRKQAECIVSNLKNNKIKHLDMKPSNLCLNEKGSLSLIDFDIATVGTILPNEVSDASFIPNRFPSMSETHAGIEILGDSHYEETYKKIIELLTIHGL
tara:strand:- start:63 stop:635 length:573 start_codon:yes stop_codon:yes gene_type:complete